MDTAAATPSAIGISISAVAVFEIHIDSAADANINPPTRRTGRAPKAAAMANAMRRCSPQRSTAAASMKPQTNR